MAASKKIFRAGNRLIIPYLAFIGAFAPISTDMYLPALPMMADNFQASHELVSLSISSFLLIFAFSMLIWGPLSDKYGRKPILMAGCLLYICSSAGIALCNDIWTMLGWRWLQAAGSGAASAMSLAIVKDILRGSLMEKVISILQAATIIAPMTAPLLGGLLLVWLSWRGIFWTLSLCGAIALLGAMNLRETASMRHASGLLTTFTRMALVLKNKKFCQPLLIFSCMAMPFMSYLGVCAFIYQDQFRLDAQVFSLFFAFNASISLLGPFAHIFLFRHWPRNMVISGHLLVIACACWLVAFFGGNGPWTFALLFALVNFSGSALRPPATILMLQGNDGDNGIVSALINCGGLLAGSLAMSVAALDIWPKFTLAVGIIGGVVAACCFAGWTFIKNESCAS